MAWLLARVGLIFGTASRAYHLAAGYGQPIIIAAAATVITVLVLGLLLFGWAKSDTIKGTVERRVGPPGKGGARVPLGTGLGWILTVLRQSIAPVAIALLVSIGVVGPSFLVRTTPFPERIENFLQKDMEKLLTQMGRDDVIFAQYKEVGKPPSSSGRFLALARGPVPGDLIVKRMFAQFLKIENYTLDGTKACELTERGGYPMATFVMTAPCGDETCVAFGRKIRDLVRSGPGGNEYDVDCFDVDAFRTLKDVLTLRWTEP